MAAPFSAGTNPAIFTAAGQTFSGGIKASYVQWDASTGSGTCALRQGAAAHPNRVLILRAGSSGGIIDAHPGVWWRDVNTATMTQGTLRIYSSP